MADINKLAENYQLGALVRHFKKSASAKAYLLFFIIGIFLFVISCLVYGLYNKWKLPELSIVILCIVPFLIPAIYLIFKEIIRETFFYEQGLVDVLGKRIIVVRYENIATVWQKVVKTKVSVYFIPLGTATNYFYSIQTDEGVKLNFSEKEAGELIQDEVYRYKMPQAVANYNAGNNVDFGPLAVSKQGISSRKETLPWSEIKDIRINDGVVYIDKQGGWFSWAVVGVEEIGNFYIFLSLLDRIFGINHR